MPLGDATVDAIAPKRVPSVQLTVGDGDSGVQGGKEAMGGGVLLLAFAEPSLEAFKGGGWNRSRAKEEVTHQMEGPVRDAGGRVEPVLGICGWG